MEHPVTPPSVADLLWPAVNFGLFVGLIVRAAGPQIRAFFSDRTTSLRTQLAAGAKARAQASAMRAEIECDIAALPALRARLAAEMRETAEHECRRLLDLAREAATRIRNDAQLASAQEFQAARGVLRAEVAAEVAQQAEELIRRTLRPEDQRRFLDEFVAGAGASS